MRFSTSTQLVRTISAAGALIGASVLLMAVAPVAGAAVSAPPIPGHFAFHSSDGADMRCSYAIGVEFAPVTNVDAYDVQYYDGYYNSDAYSFHETKAEFLAAQYSTPMSYFHGITGGNGPQPCTPGGLERFPKPPIITPEYAMGKTPPLSASTFTVTPKHLGTASIRAAAGTFPVGTSPSIEVVLKPSVALNVSQVNVRAAGHTQGLQLPAADFKAHAAVTLTTQITGAKAGTVPVTATVVGHTTHGKKVTIKASSAVHFG